MKCFFFSKAICLSLGTGVLFLLFAQRDTLFGVDDAEGTLFGGYICNLHKVGGEVHKDVRMLVSMVSETGMRLYRGLSLRYTAQP